MGPLEMLLFIPFLIYLPVIPFLSLSPFSSWYQPLPFAVGIGQCNVLDSRVQVDHQYMFLAADFFKDLLIFFFFTKFIKTFLDLLLENLFNIDLSRHYFQSKS